MISKIYLAPIRLPVGGAVEHMLRRIPERVGIPSALLAARVDTGKAVHSSRRQYNSTVLLSELLSNVPSEDVKLVGITDVDLYIPVLTFVFGEAQLGGVVAVASSHRLHNSFYGLPEDEGLLLERLEKEIVHELGHTFGLKHCEDYSCVMHSSTFVEDIDLKGPTFCRSCRVLAKI